MWWNVIADCRRLDAIVLRLLVPGQVYAALAAIHIHCQWASRLALLYRGLSRSPHGNMERTLQSQQPSSPSISRGLRRCTHAIGIAPDIFALSFHRAHSLSDFL